MKKPQRLLMTLFCTFLLVAAALYAAGEFMQVDLAFLPNASRQTQFLCSTALILLTIGLLPLSLRLFKFKKVHAELVERKAEALACWGSIRLICMGGLLVINTILYYAFGFESTYGYLAVVVLLCMPFVIPTMSRCQAEVEEEKPAEEETAPEEESQTEEEYLTEEESLTEENKEDEETNGSHRQL